jgi:hypothetical protein
MVVNNNANERYREEAVLVAFNLYHKRTGNLNHLIWGCWPDFSSGYNSLVVCYCNAQTAGLHISHDTQTIKLKSLKTHFIRPASVFNWELQDNAVLNLFCVQFEASISLLGTK